ncbi:MAG TPA: hypothetical protein VFG30_12325 [Polyangiales bacterium]|nr:hypothetical protein [Polyangiales bacterium]
MTEPPDPAQAPNAGHGQRLLLDVREVRDRMLLRLIMSLPAFAGGLWLLWTGDTLLLRVLALSGVVFATIWVVMARRSVRQLLRAGDHYLDIGAGGFTLMSGAEQHFVTWSDLEAVEIDEDRLVVRLRIRGADSLIVEPQYGELGLRELAATIESGRIHATQLVTPSPVGVRSPQS